MSNNVLIVMVGLPRSGKTTEARKLGYPIVCPDAIRLALHGAAFIGAAEPMVWVMAKYMVQALFLAGHPVVILDSTATTVARRAEWKSGQWSREYHYVGTPENVCVGRANGGPLVPIIQSMAAKFETVTDEEWDA